MRICFIAEGCYPYVVGGVSSWIHSMIQTFPDQEFILLTIIANRSLSGQFAYALPPNVTEVHELSLEDVEWESVNKHNKTRLKPEEFHALRSLMLNQDVQWDALFDFFKNNPISINRLLMGEDFYHAVLDCYNLQYPDIVFSDFLWTMRSMYLPLFLTLSMEIPRADVYHAVATGYAGILGCMGKHFYPSQLIVSEHGIYTREREEELIKAATLNYEILWEVVFGLTEQEMKSVLTEADNCSKAGSSAVDLMTNLSAIAEENASSTEQTTTSMGELNDGTNSLAKTAKELKELSEKLTNDLNYFKM